MTANVGRVDHPVIAVRDLKDTRSHYQKLGFVVPPSGQHQEWGTENLCIMFPNDYLEIRGIADPTKFLAGVDKFLETGEGFYSVAFNSANADESYREGIAAGLSIEPPKHLNRKLVLEDRVLDLHFNTVMLDHKLFPGLTHANLCEHLTFDTLRQAQWLEHPNGAVGFGRLVGVVEDFDAAEQAYISLLGPERVHREAADRITLGFGEGADVELICAKAAALRGDSQLSRGSTYLASATILVKDLEQTQNVLSGNGVRYDQVGDGSIKIDPSYACGAHIYFRELI